MSHPEPKTKLDELLTAAVDLRLQPDFADWRQKHPEAIDSLRAIPAKITQRRAKMMRIFRYSTSAAALLLFALGAWWMFFSQGTKNAWAEVIDQLAQIHSATCNMHVHHSGSDQISKAYLEGARVRVEDANQFYVTDFSKGKSLWVEHLSKKAMIQDLKKDSGGLIVLGSNPLNDLVQMKNAPAERLPDEEIGDTLCQVYHVKDTAFMGYKVPWVKLWLDPRSKLPVQIHSVVADSRDMTFNDFRWNEPFEQNLLEIVVPKGYELVDSPADEKGSKAAAVPMQSLATALGKVAATMDGAKAAQGREIQGDEIAKTLDMLGQRIEANYKAMNTWSGTFDLAQRYRHTNPSIPYHEQVSHAVGEFFAEPGRNRIRIDFRDVEPTHFIGGSQTPADFALQQSRWIRTPEHLLRFPLTKLQHTIEGFPIIEGLRPGEAFRVLYREPPKAAEQYSAQGFMDPLSFFSNGQPFWKFCSMSAGVLRGEYGADTKEYGQNNMALRERRSGSDTEYVFLQRFKPVESGQLVQVVFSLAVGFNVVCQKILLQGQPRETKEYTFRKENGVFIPFKYDLKIYEGQNAKDANRLPTQHHVFTLTKTQVNEPIDPAVFEIQSVGLRDGDRMVDWIEKRVEVFDGKQFVPADKFKHPSPGQAARDAARRTQSMKNLKKIALALLNYESARKRLPPAYTADKSGKPLLSWRVLILPYLEQDALYKAFHLDEPWDSEHNKRLIAKMPAVYKSPNGSGAAAGKTNYLTVRGENTAFPGAKGLQIADIADGTSNTIMTIEANDDKAVIWTKPDDFEYDQKDPMKGLVGLWPDGFIAAFVDGSVHFVWSSTGSSVLNALFIRNGGRKIGREALGQ